MPDIILGAAGFPGFMPGALIGTYPKVIMPMAGAAIPLVVLADNLKTRDEKNAQAQGAEK